MRPNKKFILIVLFDNIRMFINLNNSWKLGVLYSNDAATTIDFTSKILDYVCKKEIKAIILDTNHILTPDMLVGLPDKCLENILLIKPSSVSAIGHILDELITSTENGENKIILVTSLFIQIPFDIWPVYNYDPLYILYGLRNKLESGDKLKVVITIDTQIDGVRSVSYQDVINEVADWILSGFRKDNRIIIKRIK